MENASKALLISAGVLIAVMLLFLINHLFKSASSVTESYDSTMQVAEITKFNSNFTKYLDAGVSYDGTTDISVRQSATIYDVISVANFAHDYNSKVVEDPDTSEDLSTVRVDLLKSDGTLGIADLQRTNMQAKYNELLSKCYYTSYDNPNANSIVTFKIKIIKENEAGRIHHVSFQPITPAVDTFIY